ncbi:MAG TPA: 50S ribosomal protein L10 [Patescibacteria group bacterium]|nr:50S ribosomal protein L10 [Patescibacteria group bacterium]
MALSKEKKEQLVKEVNELMSNSKMTVVARYQGLSVKALQSLRNDAKDNNTKVKVIKNRLVIKAIKASDKFKDIDTSRLEGMLLYAFNSDDEVAAAQILNKFKKSNQVLEFIGGINEDGVFIDAEEIKMMAELPSKSQMLSGIINLLNSPLQSINSSLNGRLPSILNGLEAKLSN